MFLLPFQLLFQIHNEVTQLELQFIHHCSEGGFVQKLVYGTDITIAFAGLEGECSGCVVMTKESYTSVGKVWDGRITPLSPVLTKAVEDFVQDSNWTGGKRCR